MAVRARMTPSHQSVEDVRRCVREAQSKVAGPGPSQPMSEFNEEVRPCGLGNRRSSAEAGRLAKCTPQIDAHMDGCCGTVSRGCCCFSKHVCAHEQSGAHSSLPDQLAGVRAGGVHGLRPDRRPAHRDLRAACCAAAARQHIGHTACCAGAPLLAHTAATAAFVQHGGSWCALYHRQLGRHRSAQLSSASGAHMLQQRPSASGFPQHWLRQQPPCRDRRRTMNDSPLSVSANLQELLLLWFSSSCFRALRTPVRLAYVCQCLTLRFYIVRRRASPRAKPDGGSLRLCDGRIGMCTQTSSLNTFQSQAKHTHI